MCAHIKDYYYTTLHVRVHKTCDACAQLRVSSFIGFAFVMDGDATRQLPRKVFHFLESLPCLNKRQLQLILKHADQNFLDSLVELTYNIAVVGSVPLLRPACLKSERKLVKSLLAPNTTAKIRRRLLVGRPEFVRSLAKAISVVGPPSTAKTVTKTPPCPIPPQDPPRTSAETAQTSATSAAV